MSHRLALGHASQTLWQSTDASSQSSRQTWRTTSMAETDISVVRIVPETSFKNRAYEALKEAILKMDLYSTPEPVMLDERALSERLGVSRTPIREAIAMLEQDGF